MVFISDTENVEHNVDLDDSNIDDTFPMADNELDVSSE